MKVTFETTGPCRRQLKVEFSAEEVQTEYDQLLTIFRKQAKIKGFRPGKAPAELVAHHYRKEMVAEINQILISKGYNEAKKQNPCEVVAVFNEVHEDIQPGQPWEFSLTLDVMPEFTLPEYKGLSVEAKKIDVTPEALEEAIDRFLKRGGKYEDLTENRPVREDDMVAVDYTATLDGRPLAEISEKAKTLGEAHDFFVVANEEYSFLPGFGTQLVGLSVGDSKDLSVTFSQTLPVEELRGKTAVFATTIKKIRAHQKAEIDAAFLERMGMKDEAEFRNAVRSMLMQEAEKAEISRRQDELLKKLSEGVQMDLPESEIQEETNRLVYDLVNNNVRRGISEEEIRPHLQEMTDSAKTQAEINLKVKHLLEAIAKAENITVTESEIARDVEAYARQQKCTVKELARRQGRSEASLRDVIRSAWMRDRAVAFLMDNAAWTGDGAPVKEATAEPKE